MSDNESEYLWNYSKIIIITIIMIINKLLLLHIFIALQRIWKIIANVSVAEFPYQCFINRLKMVFTVELSITKSQ